MSRQRYGGARPPSTYSPGGMGRVVKDIYRAINEINKDVGSNSTSIKNISRISERSELVGDPRVFIGDVEFVQVTDTLEYGEARLWIQKGRMVSETIEARHSSDGNIYDNVAWTDISADWVVDANYPAGGYYRYRQQILPLPKGEPTLTIEVRVKGKATNVWLQRSHTFDIDKEPRIKNFSLKLGQYDQSGGLWPIYATVDGDEDVASMAFAFSESAYSDDPTTIDDSVFTLPTSPGYVNASKVKAQLLGTTAIQASGEKTIYAVARAWNAVAKGGTSSEKGTMYASIQIPATGSTTASLLADVLKTVSVKLTSTWGASAAVDVLLDGTISYPDGVSYTISSQTITVDGDLAYLFFDPDNDVGVPSVGTPSTKIQQLKASDIGGTGEAVAKALTGRRRFIGVAKGTSAPERAFFVLAGDEPVVTAPFVYTAQLSALAADMGTLTAGEAIIANATNSIWLNPSTNAGMLAIGETAGGPTGANFRVAADGTLTATGAVLTGYGKSVHYDLAANPPSGPVAGDLWYQTDTLILVRYDGVSAWDTVGTDDESWRHASDFTKIDGGTIYTQSITASQILAGTITGNEITGTTLSGVFADMGTLTAGLISLDSGKIKMGADVIAAGQSGILIGDGTVTDRIAIGKTTATTYGMIVKNAAGTVVFDTDAATPTVGGFDITGGLAINGGSITVGADLTIDGDGITLANGTGLGNEITWGSGVSRAYIYKTTAAGTDLFMTNQVGGVRIRSHDGDVAIGAGFTGGTGNVTISPGATSGTVSIDGLTYPGTAVEGGVMYGTSSGMAITPIGSIGQVLVSQGTGAPIWSDPATFVDADTLDGQHGTYYLARANHTGTQAASTITAGTFAAGSYSFVGSTLASGTEAAPGIAFAADRGFHNEGGVIGVSYGGSNVATFGASAVWLGSDTTVAGGMTLAGAVSGITSLAIGGALTGATSGAFSGTVNAGNLTSAGYVYLDQTIRLQNATATEIQSYTGAAYTNLGFDALSYTFKTSGGSAEVTIAAGGAVTMTGALTAASFSGDGSALTAVDADTLDGLDSTQFLRSDAADTATGAITFTSAADSDATVRIEGGVASTVSTDAFLDLTARTTGGVYNNAGIRVEPHSTGALGATMLLQVDGTGGALATAVTIDRTTAVTLASSLTIAGALSGVTSLSMGGALTGATTITASGTIQSGDLDQTGSVVHRNLTHDLILDSIVGKAIILRPEGTESFRATTSGATITGALALSGAITGATTGAFSGAVSTGALTSTTGLFSNGAPGVTASTYADNLVIQGTEAGGSGVTVLTKDTEVGYYVLGSVTEKTGAYWAYDHANTNTVFGTEVAGGKISFHTAHNALKWTMTSDGELLANGAMALTTTGAVSTGSLTVTDSGSYVAKVISTGTQYTVLKVGNATTGSTATDGIDFGLNDSEQGIVNVRESASLLLMTANTPRYEIDASGNHDFQSGTATFGGLITATANITNAGAYYASIDNSGYYFGAGNDAHIYHDGTDSIIRNYTGDLVLKNTDGSGMVRVEASNAVALEVEQKTASTDLILRLNSTKDSYQQFYAASVLEWGFYASAASNKFQLYDYTVSANVWETAIGDDTFYFLRNLDLNGNNLSSVGVFTVTTFSADTLDVGGGYGDTGLSVDASGNLTANGTGTFDGALSVGSTLSVSSHVYLTSGTNYIWNAASGGEILAGYDSGGFYFATGGTSPAKAVRIGGTNTTGILLTSAYVGINSGGAAGSELVRVNGIVRVEGVINGVSGMQVAGTTFVDASRNMTLGSGTITTTGAVSTGALTVTGTATISGATNPYLKLDNGTYLSYVQMSAAGVFSVNHNGANRYEISTGGNHDFKSGTATFGNTVTISSGTPQISLVDTTFTRTATIINSDGTLNLSANGATNAISIANSSGNATFAGDILASAGTEDIGSVGTPFNDVFAQGVLINATAPYSTEKLRIEASTNSPFAQFSDGTYGMHFQTYAGLAGIIGYKSGAYNDLEIRAQSGSQIIFRTDDTIDVYSDLLSGSGTEDIGSVGTPFANIYATDLTITNTFASSTVEATGGLLFANDDDGATDTLMQAWVSYGRGGVEKGVTGFWSAATTDFVVDSTVGDLVLQINGGATEVGGTLTVTGASTFSNGDATYGTGTAPSIILGANGTAAGAIKLWGVSTGNPSYIQATNSNLHLDSAGSVYFNWYDGNNVVVGNGAAGQSLRFSGNSYILFGSAEDTNLYRSAANTLKTDDAFEVGSTLTVTGLATLTAGATTPLKYQSSARGSGTGFATPDWLIYNTSSGNDLVFNDGATDILKLFNAVGATLTGTLTVTGDTAFGATTSATHRVLIQGATADNSKNALRVQDSATGSLFAVRNDGLISNYGAVEMSSTLTVTGTATVSGGAVVEATSELANDATLYVSSPTVVSDWGIKVNRAGQDYGIRVDVDTTATYAYDVYDGTSHVWRIDGTGKMAWLTDTNLYRSAANTLKTDDALVVGSTLTVTGASTFSDHITLNSGNDSFIANYNGTANHRGHLDWNSIQLGNNGWNWIVAGNTVAGGGLRFVTNNTTDLVGVDASTHNGVLAGSIAANGTWDFETAVTMDSTLTVTGASTFNGGATVPYGQSLYIGTTGSYSNVFFQGGTNNVYLKSTTGPNQIAFTDIATSAVSFFGPVSGITTLTVTGAATAEQFTDGTVNVATFFGSALSATQQAARFYGASGQTANILEVRNSSASILVSVGASGATAINSTLTVTGNTSITAGHLYGANAYDIGDSSTKRWSAVYATDINITGAIDAGAGTSLAPSYTFQSNTDTGMYSPSTNLVGIATIGVQRFQFGGSNLTYVDLDPSADASINLGWASARYNEVHAVTFHGDGSNLTNVGGNGWNLDGNTGSEFISDGGTATFQGGDGIDTVAQATDTLVISVDGTVSRTSHSHAFSAITGTAAVNQGGTGKTSWTAGSVVYASGTTTLASTGVNATATVMRLAQTSSGAPVWTQADYNELLNIPSTFAPSAHTLGSHSNVSIIDEEAMSVGMVVKVASASTFDVGNLAISYTTGTLAVSRGGTGLTSGYNNTNWDTAYGWGDHSGQNYATTTGDTFTGNITLASGIDLLAAVNNTSDIGTSGTLFRHGYFNGTVKATTFDGNTIQADGSTLNITYTGTGTHTIWKTSGTGVIDFSYTGDGNFDGTVTDGLSDGRFKENVEPITNAVPLLMDVSPVYYNYIKGAPGGFSGELSAGMIAQALLEVWPFAVRKRRDGNFTVRYQDMVPLMIAAQKETISEVDRLKARVSALEEEVAILRQTGL